MVKNAVMMPQVKPVEFCSLPLLGLNLEQEARFLNTFPPTWVTEGNDLTLQCSFTPALPQEISFFRDGEHCKNKVITGQKCDQSRHELCHYIHFLGIQLYPSSTVEIQTADHMTSITLRAVHKEHEGFYTVRLKTWNEVEHSAYIFVKGKSQVLNKCTPSASSE